jgi:hypothetical protein
MAWGNRILALLYLETSTRITLLAASEEFDPPALGSRGMSVVWPERDLVFMTTGSDGFRAWIVNPEAPSITLHKDCRESGFSSNTFSTANMAECMKHYTNGDKRNLLIGTVPSLLVSEPTFNLFAVTFPKGIPDRHRPDAAISVVKEAALECLSFKTVHNLDVRPSGLVALATSQGLAILHLSWVPALNQMPDFKAWNLIRVPANDFSPFGDRQYFVEAMTDMQAQRARELPMNHCCFPDDARFSLAAFGVLCVFCLLNFKGTYAERKPQIISEEGWRGAGRRYFSQSQLVSFGGQREDCARPNRG